MSKLLMPQQLFCTSMDGEDRCQFDDDDEFESAKVDSLKLFRHVAQRLVELLVLLCFDQRNFSIDSVFADVHERDVLCLRKIE